MTLLEEVIDLQFAVEHARHDETMETLERAILAACVFERIGGRRSAAELTERFARCVSVTFEEAAR